MFAPFPDDFFVDTYFNAINRQTYPLSIGGHLHRKQGDSLDFLDYKLYTPGDDIRHIDWRVSLTRRPIALPTEQWIVRRYEAEEQLRIVISMDTGNTMGYPRLKSNPRLCISKLQIARWIIHLITSIATRTRDQVIVHGLFGNTFSAEFVSSRGGAVGLSTMLDQLTMTPIMRTHETLQLRALDSILKPAAIWIILSDLYFPTSNNDPSTDIQELLLNRIAEAKRNRCLVVLIDLNAWNYERGLLTDAIKSKTRAVRISGMSTLGIPVDNKLDLMSNIIAETETSIEQRKYQFTQLSTSYNPYWQWDLPQELGTLHDAAAFFKTRFSQDPILAELFRKDS